MPSFDTEVLKTQWFIQYLPQIMLTQIAAFIMVVSFSLISEEGWLSVPFLAFVFGYWIMIWRRSRS
ncbi:MAG: hypothetical protein IH840_12865 [Candidatus Heimdallarchaeota archaeon]|nr:hypothetical protein [Candidatus Heimdallarchaeota archaeon]